MDTSSKIDLQCNDFIKILGVKTGRARHLGTASILLAGAILQVVKVHSDQGQCRYMHEDARQRQKLDLLIDDIQTQYYPTRPKGMVYPPLGRIGC